MDGLTVELLPAGPGDGLWIEWGPSDAERHRMVIDGGKRNDDDHLRGRLEQLAKDGGSVDLLVVTHIDTDHIEVPVELLADPVPGLQIDDLWFNDYRHLTPETKAEAEAEAKAQATSELGGKRAGRSGAHLGALLDLRDQASNQAPPFGGGAVVVPDADDGPLPEVRLAGGLVLYLLSPTAAKLERLARVWVNWSDPEWKPGNHRAALKDLGARVKKLEEAEDPDDGQARSKGKPKWGKDRSEANGSSIAFIAEYGDERWLLSGDAHADVLIDGLRRFSAQRPIEGKIPLTGFKIPHHGSVRNITVELLDLIECDHYLICTDGSGHNHPDEECIDLLVEKAGAGVHLEFSHHSEHTSKWANVEGVQATYRYHLDGEPYGEDEAVRAPATSRSGPDVADEEAEPASPDDVKMHNLDIEVTVRHGSLDKALVSECDAIMVGHFEGSTIDGAERALDDWMHGQLGRRELLGVYPGPIGTAEVIRATYHLDAVIIGMGEIGTLTTSGLTNSVAEGVLRLALKKADSYGSIGEEVPMGIKISSTLIGTTGANKLTIDNSVRAIVRGVVAANRSLLENELLDSVRVDRIEFIEAFEEIAIAATHAVGLLDTEIGGGLTGEIRPGPRMLSSYDWGGLPGQPRLDYNAGEWRPLHVQTLRDHLNFKSVGLLARAEESIHPGQRDLIEKLVRDTIDDPKAPAQTYNTLYELLIPNYLKGLVAEGDNLMLVLDDKATEFPWEMLLPQSPSIGGGTEDKRVEPVSVRTGMLRRLVTQTFRAGARRAGGNAALVIGDPPAGDEWDRLRGAQEEATTVRDLLSRQGFKVTDQIFDGDSSASVDIELKVLNSLFQDEYRIVHIAGHGEYNDEADASGVVIGETARITPLVLRQLQAIPQLVFLNCCHLGQMDVDDAQPSQPSTPLAGHFHQFAASVATQLIRDGVRAVVAAGWAVDDKPAVVFAEKFYEAMFEGSPFGEAVHRARKAVWNDPDFEQSNTWGAYQCYGDPGFKLVQKKDSPDRQASSEALPVARKELLEELLKLRQQVVDRKDPSPVTERLERLREEAIDAEADGAGQRWDDGEVLYHLADVYEALEEWEVALGFYETSLQPARSHENPVKLEVLMKMARCNMFLAFGQEGSKPDDLVLEDVSKAQKNLELLVNAAPTPGNRLALAELYRLALKLDGIDASEFIGLAAEQYARAVEGFGTDVKVGFDHRWSVLFRSLNGEPVAQIEADIDQLIEREQNEREIDVVAEGYSSLFEWELLRGIARRNLSNHIGGSVDEPGADLLIWSFTEELHNVLSWIDDPQAATIGDLRQRLGI